ncbi:histidine kinase [Geodermatophilus marinus]|nr:histidine kinase [Geodermatophilus sp. LHW52908]
MRRRDQAWRLAVALAFSLASWWQVVDERSVTGRAVDVALGAVAFALVLVRRRWPLPVAVGTTALAALSLLAAGPAILATVSLATGRRWAPIAAVGVLAVAGGEVYTALNPSVRTDPPWLGAALNTVFTLAALGWGMYIGSRRELLWSLRRRAEAAEEERDLRAERARLEERSRIAREMHDVLAHRISQISVNAGAMAYRSDLSREQMRDSAGLIRESAHLALIDLRSVLGVLRDGSGEVRHVPQPRYLDLADLIEEERRGGTRIACTDDLAREDLPEGVGRTVYRVVQEGLTNARKHAAGAAVDIELSGTRATGVEVVMRNALGFGRSSTPGAGLGLIGLTERVQLQGGRLEHGREGADFVVRAWVPWSP